MTEQEKVVFLSEKVKELNRITSEIKAVFPESTANTSKEVLQ